MASRLVVTADDFGLNTRVNQAVARAFAEGLISHASLMVNMSGFEDACRLIEAHKMQDCIGLHLNLSEGAPLTEGMHDTPFCAGGAFIPVTRTRYYRIVTPAAQRAVVDEVAAQIARARAAGFTLSHLDSHNDIHTSPAIAGVVIDVAKAHGIGRVRSARNCGTRQGTVRWLHHSRFNARLVEEGLDRIDYFGTIDDLVWLSERAPARRQYSAEASTHPQIAADGELLVDAPSMQLLALRVRLLRHRGFGAAETLFRSA